MAEWKHNPKLGWGEVWECSNCGEKTTSTVMGYPRYNYCPMCGAKMNADRKTENSSEKPNNSTSSKMEQVEDEPQTERSSE